MDCAYWFTGNTGTTDFKAVREKTGAFEGIEEEIEIIAQDLGEEIRFLDYTH